MNPDCELAWILKPGDYLELPRDFHIQASIEYKGKDFLVVGIFKGERSLRTKVVKTYRFPKEYRYN